MKSLTLVVLGVIIAVIGFIFFSAGSGAAENQPATFTIAGTVIMLGLVLFIQGTYRRGREKQTQADRLTAQLTQSELGSYPTNAATNFL